MNKIEKLIIIINRSA